MRRTYAVTVLPGDGIGPEVVSAAKRVLEASGVHFKWDTQIIGEQALRRKGRMLPTSALRSIAKTGLVLKGPTNTPKGRGHDSINVNLRMRFKTRAIVRPSQNIPGLKTRFSDVPVDIALIREGVEGEYVSKGRLVRGGAEGVSLFTKKGCREIALFAFKYAKRHDRKKITIVHKANILKRTHGLFLREARKVAKMFPEITCEDMIADVFFMHLNWHPQWFDCVLTTNLLGDLASDACAGLVGGLGFAPGANIGERVFIAEAVHGTAPDIVGKGIANPTAMILSGAMMLDHLGEARAAENVRVATYDTIRKSRLVTPNGRVNSTKVFTDAVVKRLSKLI
jgi:isocitrate dehydrogenase (NAD+)